MVERWNSYEIQLSCFMVLAVLSEIRECESVNPEGLALLEFRENIEFDPYGAFASWNLNHSKPCLWLGVYCFDGKVQMLNLSSLSLQGTIAPSLKKLRYMRSIVMSNNHLSGSIPKDIGELKLLEFLDLSHNRLSGVVPIEIAKMPSLKCMLLCGNDIRGVEDQVLESECENRLKTIGCLATNHVQKSRRSMMTKCQKCCFFKDKDDCCQNISDNDDVRRRLFEESANLAAVSSNESKIFQLENNQVILSSGAFPAIIRKRAERKSPVKLQNTTPQITSYEHHKTFDLSNKSYIIVALSLGLLAALLFALIALRRRHGVKVARAQDAALLHRISKVFVTGVPKLNSSELQTACEDFSNIIDTLSGCLVYKGILSSGVEIVVLSTSIRSAQQWSNQAQREFKTKVHIISKINHKNFVNLLGYCEEDDPFVRMMVFEYAPNGSLYEHLHVKDMDHLDWTTRMRIIMGTCYCLEHMHHELNPPILHPNLQSDAIVLTDDYAAKVIDVTFWADIVAKSKISDDEESEPLHSNPGPTCEDNVYNLGILLLEIISTKSLNIQTSQYLADKTKYRNLVDPSLKSFKNDELHIVCEVIHECVNNDPRQRPTVKEVTSKLKELIKISPESATSRHSPLWWAELEILSMDSN